MLAKLQKSLLSPKHAKLLRLEAFDEGHTLPINPHWAGFKIPYFELNGKPSDFFRFRFTQTKPSKGFGAEAEEPKKPRRYAQPAGTNCNIYMPPLLSTPWIDIAADPAIALVITEGELKAACACSLGIPTIGLGGVYSWRSAKEHQTLIPALDAFVWTGRLVNLCFDSDVATNPMVRAAASRLAKELAIRGAKVLWTELAAADDGSKQGMDDLAAAKGVEALKTALAKAKPLGEGIMLHELNCDVAVIRSTGEIVELSTGVVYSASTFSDVIYRNKLYTDWVNDVMKVKHGAKEWLAWPLRNEVTGVAYEPAINNMLTTDGRYNSWWAQGWGCEPSSVGSMEPWNQLLHRMFAGADQAVLKWMRQWFAWPLQHPGAKMASAVVIWGRQQGTGKTMLGESMSRIYGKNYGTVTPTQLIGQFNEWLQDKQFIVGDEISLGDKRHVANAIKDMVTRSQLRINSKNRKTYEVRDCVNYYLTSNHEDAVYIEPGDRRMLIWRVDADPLTQLEYQSYQTWIRNGGAPRLFYHLLNEVDTHDFDPQARPPMTAAKADMMVTGRGDLEDWCAQLRAAPDSILPRDPWDLFRPQDLLKAYDPEGRGQAKVGGMSRALGSAGLFQVAHGVNTAMIGGVRSKFWAIRNEGLYKRMGPADTARAYEAERVSKKSEGAVTRSSSKFEFTPPPVTTEKHKKEKTQ
jgi:hypothetical protein